MTIDVPYVREKFGVYNELYFRSSLPEIPIRLSNARTYVGALQYKRRRTREGKWEAYDFVMRISTRYELPESEIEDTIIHEMIHYYILYHNIPDTSMHGATFKRIMNHINTEYGRHITIRHKTTLEDHQKDTQVRQHIICVSELNDGTTGITLPTRTTIFRLWDLMPTISSVVRTRWYLSNDPYFNKFPRSRTIKIYRIPADELTGHLDEVNRLQRVGSKLIVQNRQ